MAGPPVPILVRIDGPGQVTLPAPARFAAVQTWSDGTVVNVTASAQWTITNPSVLSLSAGLATGLAAGETGLRARFGEHVSQFKTVLVMPAMPEWNGTYTLSIAGAACSGAMPPEIRQRTFTATVGQNGLTLNVDVPNTGGFVGRIFNPNVRFDSLYGSGFRSSRRTASRVNAPLLVQASSAGLAAARNRAAATDEPRLSLPGHRRAAYGLGGGSPEPARPALIETLPDGNQILIDGTASTTLSPSGFTGTLNGYLNLADPGGRTLATCVSPSHVFRLTRS